MNEPASIVSFRGVEKTYDGKVNVVEALDLEIARGEFLTLLGPSGSGKTTTLMMLAGFEAPTAGEIRLNGQSLASVPAHKRSMGMVFQNYALFPHMTVAQNLAYPLKRRGAGRQAIADAIRRAVDMVKLTGLEGRYPAQLSGGQQQRVAVARALIFQPDLVLMDEPLGALDKNLREQMQLELKHLHAQIGTTVVYVTHDQSEALTLSNRVAVFDDGKVQQLAPPEDLYEHPQNSFVAGFVGENNMLPGRVLSRQGDECMVQLADGASPVRAAAVNPGADGRTTVAIRPERLRLAPAGGGCGRANRLEATVTETIYFGDHVRLLAQMGESMLMLKVPLAEAPALSSGAPVTLACLPEHCRALDPVL